MLIGLNIMLMPTAMVLHAIPGCQVSVDDFHASKILHSLGNLYTHVKQFPFHRNLKHNNILLEDIFIAGLAKGVIVYFSQQV